MSGAFNEARAPYDVQRLLELDHDADRREDKRDGADDGGKDAFAGGAGPALFFGREGVQKEVTQAIRGLLGGKGAEAVNGMLTASKLREQFIAVLGHDLRNPLASILGVAEILLRRSQPEETRKYLGLLVGSAHRMSSLIENVLDFARGRLGAGIRLELESDVQLAETLLQVVEELRAGTDRAIKTEITLVDAVECANHRTDRVADEYSIP